MSASEQPFDRVAAGRLYAEKRWATYREKRVAEGLAPTKHAARGRETRSFDDPDLEAYWMQRADAAGLYEENTPRTSRRRIALRLAHAETEAIAQSAREERPVPTDTDVLAAFHDREIARLTAARASDLKRAEEHARLIVDHETALVEIMRRESRA